MLKYIFRFYDENTQKTNKGITDDAKKATSKEIKKEKPMQMQRIAPQRAQTKRAQVSIDTYIRN